jgi:electron transfer flavoprotein beta subunit
VEEAVRLRERLKDKVESITVVTLGPAKASETLRTALAMGADSGVHIELPESAPSPEPLGVARALRAVIERRGKAGTGTDLVIMGKQAIDDDLGQTGQMLAALLGAAQATCASKLEVDVEKRVARVRTEIDGGAEELLCSLPTVVTTDLRCVWATRLACLPSNSPRSISHVCDQKNNSLFIFPWLCAHVRLNGGCEFDGSLDSIPSLWILIFF